MKLGKNPATYNKKTLFFVDYLTNGQLPKTPSTFGNENLFPSNGWGMLGNDLHGNCVLAGGDHETMLWNKEAGRDVLFTPETALSDYGAITGFDPATGANDNGTDVLNALNYRKNTGLIDASGKRHKIIGYAALEPGNHEHLWAAMYLFSAVGIGVEFPASAMDQFNANKTWSFVKGAPNEGGHYIPGIARRFSNPQDGCLIECVTWGKTQFMTQGFYNKFCDEAYVIITDEMLINGKSIQGFDLPSLLNDIKLISAK